MYGKFQLKFLGSPLKPLCNRKTSPVCNRRVQLRRSCGGLFHRVAAQPSVLPLSATGDGRYSVPHFERNDKPMNRNPKEKLARIEIRVKPSDKEKIKQIAEKCNLPLSEYVVQRALGYAPRTVHPDAFFHFYSKLCELLNHELSPETEAAALQLFDDIYAEILNASKQNARQICKEVAEWQPPASGLSNSD